MTDISKPTWEIHQVVDNPEHNLYDSVIMEFNDIAGFPVDYYILNQDPDTLYGEDDTMTYDGPYRTKIVYEPTEEISVINQFGITSDETIQYAFIPMSTFSRDISGGNAEPMVGDVVVSLWNDKRYEIADVGAEEKIFQGKKMVYELILRPFRYATDDSTLESIATLDVLETGDDFSSAPVSAWGDNSWIEDESDEIDDYSDENNIRIFGYN